MLGRVLKDTFNVEEQIGAGGMGTVYRAVQQPLGRSVAIKVLAPTMGSRADLVKRFYREAKLLSELAHPHIVGIIDFGQTPDDGMIYMVMEFLKGKELEEVIGKRGLPIGRVRELFGQICSGVGVAHTQGLVHRDLKPANVFLARVSGDQEVVKILDFGIAKAVGDGEVELTQAGYMMGTPGYIAPEQIEDSAAADHRCDVYALGSMLYFMLTGNKPYGGKTPAAIMTRQLHDPPELIDFTTVGLPASLDSVIRKAMALEPDDRYQTTKELLDDFDAALAGVPLSAPGNPTPLPTVPPGGQGNPALQPTIQQPALTGAPAPMQTGMPLPTVPGPMPTVPGAMPTAQGPMATAQGAMATGYPMQTGYPMATQMAPQSTGKGVMLYLFGLAVLVVVAVAGIVGSGALSGVKATEVADVRDAALGLRDELARRRKVAVEAAAKAGDQVSKLKADLASATDEEREAAERALWAAQKDKLFHEGVVKLGDRLIFEGSDDWQAVAGVLKRAEGAESAGQLEEAKRQFDAANAKLKDLKLKVARVEGVQRACAGALVQKARWEARSEAAGVARTAAARAADALQTAGSLANKGVFDDARKQYEAAERLFGEAIGEAEKALEEARAAALDLRAKAELARSNVTRLVGKGDAPEGLAKADALRDQARKAMTGGMFAEAKRKFSAAKNGYEALASELSTATEEARKTAEEVRKKAEARLKAIDALLAPGELKEPAALLQARAAVERGIKSTSDGDHAAAKQAYTEALAKAGEARGALDAAVRADQQALAEARGGWTAMQAAAEDALKIANESLARDHATILKQAGQADKDGKSGRYKEAARAYRAARKEMQAWTGKVYYEQGQALLEEENHEKALPLFRRAVKVDPTQLSYRVKLGQALYGLNKYDEALAELKKVTAADARNRDAHLQIGLCHSVKREFPEAAASFRKAVALDPDYWESNYYLGLILSQSSKPERRREAITILRKAKKNAPKSKHAQIDQTLKALGG